MPKLVRADYPYTAVDDTELSLAVGDVLTVLEEYDNGWWVGELSGKVGVFPGTYVSLVVSPVASPSVDSSKSVNAADSQPKDSAVVSGVAYNARGAESTQPSLTVTPSQATLSGNTEGGANNSSSLGNAGKDMLFARAVSDHPARHNAQLSFVKGDVVRVIEQFPTGWWRGELNGKTGLFTKVNVQLMSSKEQREYLSTFNSTAPAAANTSVAPTATTVAVTPTEPTSNTAATTTTTTSTAATTATTATTATSTTTADTTASLKVPKQDQPIKAVAITDYTGARADELSFSKGAVITVLAQQDRWWTGQLDSTDERGRFPAECVKVLSAQEDKDQATALSRRRSATRAARRVPLARAEMLYDFEGTGSTELTLKAGDQVNVLNYLEGVPGGWWKGEFEGRVGHFPKDFAKVVEVLTPDEMDQHYQKNLEAQEKQQAKRKPSTPIARLRALYDYTAGSATEVSFVKGDMIDLWIKKEEEGWWKGEVNGNVGHFPSSYVELVEDLTVGSSSKTDPVTKAAQTEEETAAAVVASSTPTADAATASAATAESATASVTPADVARPPGEPANPTRLIAMYTFEPESRTEVGFTKGEALLLYKDVGDGWLKGKVVSTGAVGHFPSSFVKVVEDTEEVVVAAAATPSAAESAQGEPSASSTAKDSADAPPATATATATAKAAASEAEDTCSGDETDEAAEEDQTTETSATAETTTVKFDETAELSRSTASPKGKSGRSSSSKKKRSGSSKSSRSRVSSGEIAQLRAAIDELNKKVQGELQRADTHQPLFEALCARVDELQAAHEHTRQCVESATVEQSQLRLSVEKAAAAAAEAASAAAAAVATAAQAKCMAEEREAEKQQEHDAAETAAINQAEVDAAASLAAEAKRDAERTAEELSSLRGELHSLRQLFEQHSSEECPKVVAAPSVAVSAVAVESASGEDEASQGQSAVTAELATKLDAVEHALQEHSETHRALVEAAEQRLAQSVEEVRASTASSVSALEAGLESTRREQAALEQESAQQKELLGGVQEQLSALQTAQQARDLEPVVVPPEAVPVVDTSAIEEEVSTLRTNTEAVNEELSARLAQALVLIDKQQLAMQQLVSDTNSRFEQMNAQIEKLTEEASKAALSKPVRSDSMARALPPRPSPPRGGATAAVAPAPAAHQAPGALRGSRGRAPLRPRGGHRAAPVPPGAQRANAPLPPGAQRRVAPLPPGAESLEQRLALESRQRRDLEAIVHALKQEIQMLDQRVRKLQLEQEQANSELMQHRLRPTGVDLTK
eukprot:CAMPEP_0177665128 /NCGR_PEP_ID=MMETSP0447-20121125/20881_1 /TAXON_ID=0 /ORGANISM="Stygamoeba regulata, Strain BSH-02190019" /LENGTH=1272 /DNA_ID=CAMNT_0019171185 /DNA_START=84 /DNA_END=3902 /DNA_ORIENTATION=+